MRNLLFLALLSLAVIAVACKGQPKTIDTEHGYRFINHTNKEGAKAQGGQTISVNVYTFIGDSLLGSTVRDFGGPRELKLPTLEQIGTQKVPALFEAATLMAEGDSATIFQELDSMSLRAIPEGLKGNKEVRFEIVLVDIKSDEEIQAEQQKAAAEAEVAKAQGVEIATMLNQTINDYKANKLGDRLKKTASGLEYVILQPGTGAPLKDGDMVQTHYYGVLESTGKMFDNSYDRGQRMPFPVGQLVPGFNEGMQLIGRGGKGVLFIPYNLAYGEAENGPIPAKSDLVFYVDLDEGASMPAGHGPGDGHNH
jgi:FKBP-type peptidyl-prolyl cis-trans isomerase FkpA